MAWPESILALLVALVSVLAIALPASLRLLSPGDQLRSSLLRITRQDSSGLTLRGKVVITNVGFRPGHVVDVEFRAYDEARHVFVAASLIGGMGLDSSLGFTVQPGQAVEIPFTVMEVKNVRLVESTTDTILLISTSCEIRVHTLRFDASRQELPPLIWDCGTFSPEALDTRMR